jgi:hypothetical protein
MERNAMPASGCEHFETTSAGAETTSAGARNETNKSNEEALYWGVLCRTCRELVAFDACPYASFGPAAASIRPGAIRCSQEHNHIYFPRDFGFRASEVPIAETVMRENRDIYRAINSQGIRSSHEYVPEAVEPEAKPEAGESEGRLESGKARPPKIGPDPRREAAKAAKERWTNWAEKKMA